MDSLVVLLKDNQILLYVSIGLIVIVVILFIIAYREGREISAFSLKIGGREKKSDIKNDIIRPIDCEIYLNREDVHWTPFSEKVSYRYWVCGTSLMGVTERGSIPKYLKAGIKDIKVILPNTDHVFCSYEQLEKYDRLPDGVYNQVQAAKASFEKLNNDILAYIEKTEEYLRKYSGIMYSNITIFDDDAFISFYNYTGAGDSNFTLRFNRATNERGYRLVEEEFLRMWNAKSDYGTKSK